MVFFAALLLLLAERSQFYNDAKVVYNLWSFAQCWVIFHIRGGVKFFFCQYLFGLSMKHKIKYSTQCGKLIGRLGLTRGEKSKD